MKKFIICALFAWWFMVVSEGGGSYRNVMGPYATEEQCKETNEIVFEAFNSGALSWDAGISDCISIQRYSHVPESLDRKEILE